MNSKKYFNFIILLLMANTFLPVLFTNLPPVFRSHHPWAVLWGASLLVFYSRVFKSKLMLLVLAYAVFVIIGLNTFWNNMNEWNIKMLYRELYSIAIGASVVSYFTFSKDYHSWANLTKWVIIFIFITAVMTIISSAIDPMYARNIIGVGAINNQSVREGILSFRHYGGGEYGYAISFMSLLPILLYYYRRNELININRIYILVYIIVISMALIGMQIFANVFIALIIGFFVITGARNIRKSIIISMFLIVIVLLIPQRIYIQGLLGASNLFESGTEINSKFRDMSNFLEIGAVVDKNTEAGIRSERYPILYESFKESPFLGCYYLSGWDGNGYEEVGAHLHWMNKLTITGIIGLFIFILIPLYFLRIVLKQINSEIKFYFLLAIFSFIALGFIKTISGREALYTFFIILPGLIHLPLLKKKSTVTS